MGFWSSFWGIFIIVAGGAGVISGFIAAVVAIIQYIKTGTNFIRKFLRGHGVRADVNELRESVMVLNQTIDGLQKMAERNTKRLCNITDELDANTRLTLKLELKSLFRNHPEEILVIEKTWQKYHDLGGDSYIDDMYEVWKKKYVEPKLEAKFKKGAK